MTTNEFKSELADTKAVIYNSLTDLARMAFHCGIVPATTKQINYLANLLAFEITKAGGVTLELLEAVGLDADSHDADCSCAYGSNDSCAPWNFTVLSKSIASESIGLLA